jgi:hypothetical protein
VTPEKPGAKAVLEQVERNKKQATRKVKDEYGGSSLLSE